VWAGNSGSQPGAGIGTSYVYTHLGQLWQGPQGNSGSPSQYLYCDSSHPHQLTGLYQMGSTCSNKLGQRYASSYDAWGNVTARMVNGTSATLSYDGLDHLTSWNAGSTGQEQYVYDASGERVLRRSTSAGSTSMTVYAFGLEEHRYSGSGVGQGNTYYYSLGGLLIGEFDGTNTNMYLTDALGSVITTISAAAGSAAVQGNQVYGPYGTARYQQGSLDTTKGFTGQYNDSLSGLDYYNARYYDPVVGRFLSADPIQGNLQGMDPYAYVGGNPETFSDPTGQSYKPFSGGGLAEELLEAEGGGDGTGGPGVGPNTPGPDLTVTNGNVTDTLNTNTGSITQETVSPDGTTWTDLQPGTTAYEDALTQIEGTPDESNSAPAQEPEATAPSETSSTTSATPPGSGETPSSEAGGQTPPTVPETPTTTSPEPPTPPEQPPTQVANTSDSNTTSIDLYRNGNSQSPRLDNVRPNKEYIVGPNGEHILYPGQEPANGISTFETQGEGKNWWKLPAGSPVPNGLQFRNDEPGHWALEPIYPTSLDDYKSLAQQSLQYWRGPLPPLP